MCEINQPDLYAMPTVYYVCGVDMQRICEIIVMKIAVCKNLDPQKFSTIW